MSFINRRTMRFAGRVIVLMLLFAQSLSAAQPCQMSEQKPAMAFGDMAGMDCAEKGNPNACLLQCIGTDQNTNHVPVGIADVRRITVLTVTIADSRDVPPAIPVVRPAHSTDPPPTIRFCSFQI
ncbi:MAG: hypothetical protein ABI771_08710 [Betaproteobacteria bacterium]